MKPTALGLLIAAAAFGGSTLFLAMQLQQERAQSDQLAAEARALNARIAELESARAQRHFAAVNPFAPVMSPPGPPSGHPPLVEETSGSDGDLVELVTHNAPPRNDEVFQKMMRSQARAHNKQRYADIGARLGLSKDDANKLIVLLTEQQLQGVSASNEALSVEDTLRLLQEKQVKDKAQIAELLGADKAEAFEEYQQSVPARQELDMLARQFDGADTPLSDDQKKRLLEVLAEERKRVPAPTMADATSLEEYSHDYIAWQGNYDEIVASHVRTILNSEQLATYNEYHEWQQQMRSQMAVIGASRFQHTPGGPNVMFTTAAPAVSADVAIETPVPAERPRK